VRSTTNAILNIVRKVNGGTTENSLNFELGWVAGEVLICFVAATDLLRVRSPLTGRCGALKYQVGVW
jgi:hypothetical protein